MSYTKNNLKNSYSDLLSESILTKIASKKLESMESPDPDAKEVISEIIEVLKKSNEKSSIIINELIKVLDKMEDDLLDEDGNFKSANPFKLQFANIKAYIDFAKYVRTVVMKIGELFGKD